MENENKLVCFDKYCQKCLHSDKSGEEEPCDECLTYPANYNSHKPIHFVDINDGYAPKEEDLIPGYYKSLKKKKDFFYEVSYDDLDYAFAKSYYRRNGELNGACSAVRNGNFIGRNFDWFYNNQAEFLVRVNSNGRRYSSIGISSGFSDLTKDVVESKTTNQLYRLVPFQMVDGINEHGLFAEINVVPDDYGHNIAKPRKDVYNRINALMLVRYVLDNFRTAFEAVMYLRDHVEIDFPKKLHEMEYEAHWMIADEDYCFIVEIIDNRLVVRPLKVSTNFHVYHAIFNPDFTVYTPASSDSEHGPVYSNHLTPHASGLERWNVAINGYSSADTKTGMRNLMDQLMYTRSYYGSPNVADPFWYTEYVGEDNHCDSPIEKLEKTAREYEELFLNRSRDTAHTWQSVHSAVYDIQNRSLSVITQEHGSEMNFDLE